MKIRNRFKTQYLGHVQIGLLDIERALQTKRIAAFRGTERRAAADGPPRPIHRRTTAAEHHVILEFVLLAGRAGADAQKGGRGALDCDHGQLVVGVREHIAAEPVRLIAE